MNSGETCLSESESRPKSTIILTPTSDLGLIRDKAKELRERAATKGYTECKDDALAVSQLAEDLRDVLLEYQVGSNPAKSVLP